MALYFVNKANKDFCACHMSVISHTLTLYPPGKSKGKFTFIADVGPEYEYSFSFYLDLYQDILILWLEFL